VADRRRQEWRRPEYQEQWQMKTQKNGPIVTVVVVVAGSLIGLMFAAMLISGSGMMGRYSYGDAIRDWIILSVGVVLGAILFSWASKR
jgi:hypothetical protein